VSTDHASIAAQVARLKAGKSAADSAVPGHNDPAEASSVGAMATEFEGAVSHLANKARVNATGPNKGRSPASFEGCEAALLKPATQLPHLEMKKNGICFLSNTTLRDRCLMVSAGRPLEYIGESLANRATTMGGEWSMINRGVGVNDLPPDNAPPCDDDILKPNTSVVHETAEICDTPLACDKNTNATFLAMEVSTSCQVSSIIALFQFFLFLFLRPGGNSRARIH